MPLRGKELRQLAKQSEIEAELLETRLGRTQIELLTEVQSAARAHAAMQNLQKDAERTKCQFQEAERISGDKLRRLGADKVNTSRNTTI